jgi:hypothetical protein
MKRLVVLLLLVTACATDTPLVTTAQIDIPAGASAVQGANPRRWNQPLSFGPWRTASVDEGTARTWLADLGVLQLGSSDQAYRLALQGSGVATNVDCHTRELVAGRAGVFVQASLGQSPILVCGFERGATRAILALTRTGRPEPSLRGELRQVNGITYDVVSVHRAGRSNIPGAEPFGYEIRLDERPLAIVETINRGRVWIDPDAPNRDDLAAAAAALLLFDDPHA